MKKNVLLEIKSLYPQLGPAEQRVADTVLAVPNEVLYLAVTQLAEQCGVGDGTVVRFCQKLGLKGYGELKLALAANLSQNSRWLEISEVKTDDSMVTLIQNIAKADSRTVEDTASFMDPQVVKMVIAHIKQSRKIEVFAVGASAVAASAVEQRFLRLGLTAQFLADQHLQAMAAANLTGDDAAIAISHSGSTTDTVSALRIAFEAGAFCVAITNHKRSPITQNAHAALLTASPETPLGSGAIRSTIAQLYIIDVLFTAIATELGANAYKSIEKTAQAVVERLI